MKKRRNTENNSERKINIFQNLARKYKTLFNSLIIILIVLVVYQIKNEFKTQKSYFKDIQITPGFSSNQTLTPTPTLTDKEEAINIISEINFNCPDGNGVFNWLVSTINKNSISSKEESEKAKGNNKQLWACYILYGDSYGTSPLPIQYIAPTIDSDPIVDCKFTYLGIIRLKRSVCSKSTDCQIGGKWIYYDSVDKCKQDQKTEVDQKFQQWKDNNPIYTIAPWPTYPNYPPCIVYYPALGYSQTYLFTSPEQCQQWKNNVNSTTTTVYTPSQIIPTNQPQSNKPSQDQIDKCKSKVREEADNLFHGCVNQFGDSSAANMCMIARQKEISTQITNCENYGTHTPMSRYIQRDPTPTCRMTPYGCF